MIGKLRIKLIIASMCSLLIVLAVILSVSGILSYRKLTSDADSLLAILAENGGNFPKREHPAEEPPPPSDRYRGDRRFSPELPYELRVFLSLPGAGRTVLSVNTGK